MSTAWEVTLQQKQLPKLHNPLLVEGLPGIGNVGKITSDFLVEHFKAKKLYSFYSHKFPHSVFVSPIGIIEAPKLDLYFKAGNGKHRDLLILIGDIQPIDEESCYSFCEEVIRVCKRLDCKEIVTTGGIGLEHVQDPPQVFIAATSEKVITQFTKPKLGVQRDIFGIVGPIVGVSGILLAVGGRREMDGACLLAETYAHPLYLGIKGAKQILSVIDKKYLLQLNLKKLNKDIGDMEEDLLKKTHEWSENVLSSKKGKPHKDQNYIG